MREYRGKRVSDGEWVYGHHIELEGISYILDENVALAIWNVGDDVPFQIQGFTPVIPETVGQYTGIDDKDGTKIFEGDMVKYSGNTFIPYEVVVSDGAFVLQSIPPGLTTSFRTLIRGDGATSKDFEVIGNIHGEEVTA